MTRTSKEKGIAAKRKSSEIQDNSTRRKIKFSERGATGVGSKETTATIASSGKQIESVVNPPLRTRSGQKIIAKNLDYDVTISANNNATRSAQKAPTINEQAHKSRGLSKSLKSPKVRNTATEVAFVGGVNHSHDKMRNVNPSHDKMRDARNFDSLDNLLNVQSHLQGGEEEFDGIDVTINPSDDEFTEFEPQLQVQQATTGQQGLVTVNSVHPVMSGPSQEGTAESFISSDSQGLTLDLAKLQQENANLRLLIYELVNQKVQMKLAEVGGQPLQPVRSQDRSDVRTNKPSKCVTGRSNVDVEVMKSPSDTTIYAPALHHQGK